MSHRLTIAALVLIVGAGTVSTAKAERLGVKSWRWTSWNVRPAVAPTPVAAAPAPAPVAPVSQPTPVPVMQAPAPIFTQPVDNSAQSSRFAVTNPNPTPTPLAISQASIPVSAPTPRVDAFLNFGEGPYPDAALMTEGNGSAWYNSPVVNKVFGGTPNEQQRADFTNSVLNGVKGVYARSGLGNLTFSTDPNVAADHTMSVASGLSYPGNSNVIGITNVGQDGVSLIDKLTAANTPGQLATALANNMSHELMHAFGICEHFHKDGANVDAADATWATLTDPNATLSPEAVEAIRNRTSSINVASFGSEILENGGLALETLSPTPVPEPSTIALWSLAGIAALYTRRRGRMTSR